MVNKHMARCSISLIIRKIKMRKTMMYLFTSIRMSIIKMTENNKCW